MNENKLKTIKEKKEKLSSSGESSGGANGSGGNSKGSNSNNSTTTPSTNTNASSNKTSSNSGNSSSNINKNSSGKKDESCDQGTPEQLVNTSVKHHSDGSPPANIIKKEPITNPSSVGAPASSSNGNSNDSNNNNDLNDAKSVNSGNPLLSDDKEPTNESSIPDDLLNSDDLNNTPSNSNSGMQIKSEDISGEQAEGGDHHNFMPNASGSNTRQNSNAPERIQPLPSNVVSNKQSNSLDYMQQQSHIFVFSTVLANKGAEAVRNGQYLTIIAFHCAQTETKKFLQKFPLKNNQFNRPGWFSNLNKNQQQQQQQQQQQNNKRMMNSNQQQQQQNFNFMKNNQMNPQQQPGNNMMNPMGMQGNFPSQNPCMNNSEGNMMWGGPGNPMNNTMGNNSALNDSLFGDSLDSLVNDSLDPSVDCLDPSNPNIPSLQGVKVPDEDLTPQQRQQRAFKLAQLQNIKQMLKQEPPGDIPLAEQDLNACKMPPGPHNQQNPQQMPVGPPGMNQMPMGPVMPGMNPNNNIRHMGPRAMNPQQMNENMIGGMHNQMGNVQGMNPGMMMGNNGGMNSPNPMHPGMQGGNNMNMPPMNMMGPGNMMQQKVMSPNVNPEWNKMQNDFHEGPANKRKGGPGGMPPAGMCGPMDMNDPLGPNPNFMNRQMPPNAMRNMGNIRGQGPPPPYHQTSRSSSVSMATQSPNPNSPNPTSNLSLPSPRAVNSALNSPAPGDPGRHMGMKNLNTRQSPTNNSSQGSPASTLNRQINHSSPSTPVSSHLSPSASIKDLEMNPNIPKTEPNLMPVPSPQQISYMNAFDNQELTIQKQPNTSVKDGCPNMNMMNQGNVDNRHPGQKTPTSSSNQHMNNFISSPITPGASSMSGDKSRMNQSGPSPQTPNSLQRSNSMMNNEFPNVNQQSNESNVPFSPHDNFGINNPSQQQQQPPPPNPQHKMNPFMDQKPHDMVGNNNSAQFMQQCGRPSDMPLNPNNANMMPAKPSHFDPISSLTQMSQQLTSTGMPNNMNGQQQQQMMGGFNNNVMMNEMNNPMGMNPEGGMPPMGNPNQMDMGGMGGNPNMQQQFAGPRSMSPKIGGPPMGGFPGPGGMPNMNMRMVRPPMGYNGTNIQVKPNAPNTIQYLPARPQINNSNPPRPPSLDFLQRYTNPMGMDEMNKGGMVNPQQNMPYFQNQNNPNPMGGMVDPLEGNANNPMGMNPMMGQNPMMMRGMPQRNPGNPMMRFPPGNQNPCMMNNNNFNAPPNNPNQMGGNPNEQMMFNNQGPQMQNPHMFNVPGPKVSPGHEQMQQMHMMGGQPGQGPPPNFKQQQQQQPAQPFNSGDPNYAQQYHNFQQQLYATNNPARGNQMGMAANQAFMPK